VDAIKALAALGASVITPTNIGVTPILLAANNGHVATIKLLYKLGVDLGCYTLPSGEKVSVLDTAEEADQEAAFELIKSILRKIECECECCGSSTKKLSLCSRCQKVRSRECQVKDHKKHRSECKATLAARASSSSEEPSAAASASVATAGST